MKLSEQIKSLANSIAIAESEAAEYRMECDRVGQAKAEKSAKEYKAELDILLAAVDYLEKKESHQHNS